MADDSVYDRVEDLGGHGVSLGYATVSLKRMSKVYAGPGYHGQAAPFCPNNSDHSVGAPIRRDNHKAPVSVQVIVCLLEIQENLEEDHLSHGRKLLEQLGIEGIGPHLTALLEPVQHVMERDR